MKPLFHRFAVGSFECTSLCDGEKEYPISDIFVEAPEEEVRSALRSRGSRDDLVVTPYSYLHVDTGTHQILVDAGAGKLFPATGRLLDAMLQAEIDPEVIDTLIITHAHPDHIGGLLREEGAPAFPNASYLMWRREWEFWHSDAERARAKETQQWFFDFARKALAPIRERIRFVDLAAEPLSLFPGVSLLAASGHTPGHMVALFGSGRERLLYIGDAVISPIHLEHPEWTPVYDIMPREAADTKRRLFDLAADEGALVLGQHFPPFPSIGRVTRQGVAWQWQPVAVEAYRD